MSRSIHTTNRHFSLENRFEYSSDSKKKENVQEIIDDIHKKRKIKASIRELKQKKQINEFPIQSTIKDNIKIEFKDDLLYAHYLITMEDVLNICSYFSPDTLGGLNSIIFELGKEDNEDNLKKDEFYITESLYNEDYKIYDRDPFTGRFTEHIREKLYFGRILGMYILNTNDIKIYAYVYDDKIINSELLLFYLKLKMMSTLVHEIAHHYDFTQRRDIRGRTGTNYDKNENFAIDTESEYFKSITKLFIENHYKEESNRLEEFIFEHSGIYFPLEKIFARNRKDTYWTVTSIESTIEELFFDILEGVSPNEIKNNFAQNLHYCNYFSECIEVLKILNLKDPNNTDYLILIADSYDHIDDYDNAEKYAKLVLEIDHSNSEAYSILCNVAKNNRNWELLYDYASINAELLREKADNDYFKQLNCKYEASILLNNFENAIAIFEQIKFIKYKSQDFIIAEIICFMIAGDYENATRSISLFKENHSIYSWNGIIVKKLEIIIANKTGQKTKLIVTEEEQDNISEYWNELLSKL